MDSPDVGSREDMIEPGKRRKILDGSDFSKDKDRSTEYVSDWVDTADRKHRGSKSRKNGKGDREARTVKSKGYSGVDDRVVDGNGDYSDDEKAGAGHEKRGEKVDTSWDIPDGGRSKRKSSRDKRATKLEKVSIGDSGGRDDSGEKEERGWGQVKEGRDESERSDREIGHREVLGTRSSASNKKKAVTRSGKVGDGVDYEEERKGARDVVESDDERGRRYERDDEEKTDRAGKGMVGGTGRSRSRSRGERGYEVEKDLSGDRITAWEDSEEVRQAEKKKNGREKLRGAKCDREEPSDKFEGEDDGRVDAECDEEDGRRKVEERGGKRAGRDRGRGERNEPCKEEGPEPLREKERNKGGERIDSKWDDSEEGKAGGRSKRSREDDRRDRSRGKDRGDSVLDDNEDGTKASVWVRDDSRGDRQHQRNERVDEWVELESGTRSSGRKKLDRAVDDRLDKISGRDKEILGDRIAGWEDTEEIRQTEKRRNNREKLRGAKGDKEEPSDKFEGEDDDKVNVEWDEVEDRRRKVEERGGKRVGRERGRGERNELLKDDGPEPLRDKERSKGGERIDTKRDDSEEGKAGGRSKRSRDDDRRDRSRVKDRGDGVQDDHEDGAKASVWVRDDSRGDRQQLRNERVDEWVELESGTRSSGRKKVDRAVDDRLDRARGRDRVEGGRDEAEDGRKGRGEKVDEDVSDKVVGAGREMSFEVTEELGRHSARPRVEKEAERTEKQRDRTLRDRAEGIRESAEEGGKLLARSRGDDERGDKLKARERADGGREESEDGGRSGGRSKSLKNWKDSWSPDIRKGGRVDWDEGQRDWLDEREELERPSGRREREKDRDRYLEREAIHEKSYDDSWEKGRRREWEEFADRRKDRPRERYKDRDDKGRDRESEQEIERESWEADRRRERVERERSGRERFEREMDRERMERDRGEGLTSPNAVGMLGDVIGRSGSVVPLPPNVEPGRGILASGPFMPRVGVDNGMLQGEYMMGGGDGDWEGPIPDERMRMGDGGYLHDSRDRFTNEDEPPAGLDQGFGPSPGRGGGNDAGMGFNLHRGNGRAKGSPSNRGRGQVVMHEGRPIFLNNQGGGLLMRNMQQGVKGGRGRGPGKGGRGGGGRDNQRSNVTVISQMGPGPGPGLPGPHFGPLGPPGPMPGLGPGMMGPGGFQISPFQAPIGWGGNRGAGDMGMMNGPPGPGPGPGPPRFGPGMGPGGPPVPGPNMFFTPPGPGRGGPGAIVPGGMFGGGSPFGGRPMPGDRGPPGGRGASRGGGPSGRGPSRGEQNDYSQHFVDTGLRPQNFIRDVELADRFEEYPKLKELISRKDKLIADRATPPMYMQCDLRTTELRPEVFGTKFDVILVDPPWEEYVRRAPGVGDSMEWWSYEDIQNLRIEAISDTPAFIFLWVGDAEGLDQGRLCLKKWGFRRCEDICWVKTNRENPTPALRHDANTLLQHSKEHCLMGIKGTVRRSTDGHIIHANVDTDIIISEEPPYGSTMKPEELYHIIEHFAQGQRRLELFGEDHNIRAGWVTVGKGLSSSNFSPQMYAKHFVDAEGKVWQGGRGNPPVDAPHLVGTTPEIEALRPKSPPPRAQQQPPSQAANSNPPTAGGNSNSKKPLSTSQGGSQNGPPVSIGMAVQGHGLHSQASSVGGSSRGGGGVAHVQPPKPRPNSAGQGSKPYLIAASSGIESVAASDEPSSGPELVEMSGEREGGGIADQSKTLSS